MGLKVYKVYEVDGDGIADYGALSFEQKYAGRKVGEVCEELLAGKKTYVYEDEETVFRIRYKFETTDRIAFFAQRDTQDYDDSKHQKLYMEDEIL